MKRRRPILGCGLAYLRIPGNGHETTRAARSAVAAAAAGGSQHDRRGFRVQNNESEARTAEQVQEIYALVQANR